MTKQTPKKRPASKKKTSTTKKPTASRGWTKKLLSLGFKLTLVGLAALAILGIYLDGKIRDRFDGQIWQLPAVVYGRILHLAPGDEVTIDELKRELDLLNYNKVRTPSRPGEYSSSSSRVELIRRSFEFEDGPQPAKHVMVTFSSEGVKAIKQLDDGKQRGYLRIEPKLLG